MTNDTRLALAKDLVAAIEKGDDDSIDSLLGEIAVIRETQMFKELGQLTRQLHDALRSFDLDEKIAAFKENDIADAKERLQYVVSMTEDAADKTLTTVENLLPVSEELNEKAAELSAKWGRFLDREMPFEEFKSMSHEITEHFNNSKKSLEHVQHGLNDILMAQGFQDITGQVIKQVIELVRDLETNMVDLISLSGIKMEMSKAEDQEKKEVKAQGPVVPGVDDKFGGVAETQDEVDDLLSSLGF